MQTTSDRSTSMLLTLGGICAVCLVGVVGGLLLPTTIVSAMVVAAALIWIVLGKVLGGWPLVVAGLFALFAALSATYGSQAFSAYPLALMFTAVACVIVLIGLNNRGKGTPSR